MRICMGTGAENPTPARAVKLSALMGALDVHFVRLAFADYGCEEMRSALKGIRHAIEPGERYIR